MIIWTLVHLIITAVHYAHAAKLWNYDSYICFTLPIVFVYLPTAVINAVDKLQHAHAIYRAVVWVYLILIK